ncbi:MAG: hypothetical protein JHC61_04850 [Burkholderiaceae bacterium]|nr:hypothetical protein [Burkholderiaceae bacterium]
MAKQARRAQLHALLPVVHELSRQGVPHESLAAKMSAGGIPITATALRKALSRWRKRQAQVGAQSPANTPSAIATRTPPSTPVGFAGRGITSKADLVRLRNAHESIDLNQLAELSRQK